MMMSPQNGGRLWAKKRKITVASSENEPDYTYVELLARAMALVSDHHFLQDQCRSSQGSNEKPQLMRVGGHKTLWVNFTAMCQLIQRSREHVREFYVRELGKATWMDEDGRLMIRGRYVPKYMNELWHKYLQEYVTCRSCGLKDSMLARDSIVRRNYIVYCQCCGASFCAGSSLL